MIIENQKKMLNFLLLSNLPQPAQASRFKRWFASMITICAGVTAGPALGILLRSDDWRWFSVIFRENLWSNTAKRWLACAYLIIIPTILLNLVNKTWVEIIDIWHVQVY